MTAAEAAVQRQLDAYNARDLARFVAEYTDDVEVFRPPATAPAIRGKPAFADHYAKNRFNLPALNARVVNRIVAGDIVVDQEEVSGIGDGVMKAVAVYKVVDGRIRSVWFF